MSELGKEGLGLHGGELQFAQTDFAKVLAKQSRHTPFQGAFREPSKVSGQSVG